MTTSNLLDKDITKLTQAIIRSYSHERTTQRIGEVFLPSREKIVETLDLIQQLLFPGYYGRKQLTKENLPYHVGSLVMRIGKNLVEQIYACHCAAQCKETCGDTCREQACRKEAQQMAHDFISCVPAIRKALALDAAAFYDNDPAAKSIDEVIYCYPGYYAIIVYRIAHELLKIGVPLMPRIFSERAHGLTGTDIHPGASIGKRFFIDHATGVVIGETTIIGDNVKIYQGVTLGAKSFPKDDRGRAVKGHKRHPTIEDNVTIYPNATILGGDTLIGKDTTVGGNAYITSSVPANTLVKQEDPTLQVLKKPAKKKNHAESPKQPA